MDPADKNTQPLPALNKILRDSQGIELPTLALPIPWSQETQRIIDITSLASAMQQKTNAATFTSAQFALQMTEGVEEVIFQRR
jgi:hypothetical protein